MHPQHIPSTFINFLFATRPFINLRQLPVRPLVLTGPSVNFKCLRMIFRQIPSTFSASARPSCNFCQLSVQLWDISSKFDNFPCGCETLCQLLVRPRCLGQLFVQQKDHLSNFYVAAGPSVNFHELSVQPQDLLSISVNSLCACGTFHQLPSTVRAVVRHSVIYLLLSLRSRNLPLTSVNFLCFLGTFRPFSVNFHASAGQSINFCQHSVPPLDLPSTSDNDLYVRTKFHQHQTTFCASADIRSTSFNIS